MPLRNLDFMMKELKCSFDFFGAPVPRGFYFLQCIEGEYFVVVHFLTEIIPGFFRAELCKGVRKELDDARFWINERDAREHLADTPVYFQPAVQHPRRELNDDGDALWPAVPVLRLFQFIEKLNLKLNRD